MLDSTWSTGSSDCSARHRGCLPEACCASSSLSYFITHGSQATCCSAQTHDGRSLFVTLQGKTDGPCCHLRVCVCPHAQGRSSTPSTGRRLKALTAASGCSRSDAQPLEPPCACSAGTASQGNAAVMRCELPSTAAARGTLGAKVRAKRTCWGSASGARAGRRPHQDYVRADRSEQRCRRHDHDGYLAPPSRVERCGTAETHRPAVSAVPWDRHYSCMVGAGSPASVLQWVKLELRPDRPSC
jgi:hypothetical protein